MTEPAPDAQADLTRLRKLIAKKKFDELEAAWLEALARPGANYDALLSLLEPLSRRDEAGVADSLFWFMLSQAAERREPDTTLGLVRRAAGFLAGNADLRQEIAAAYRLAHPGRSEVQAMTEMTVLALGVPFPVAVARLDKLLSLKPGACVIDTQHEKLGQVTSFDAEKKSLEVSYPDRPRSYDRLGIDKLEVLAADDFRSRVAADRAALEQMAQETPAEMVKVILRTYGPRVEFKDFKDHIKEIIPSAAWSKWWSKAKAAIKRDPLLEMSDGVQPWLFLRSRPLAWEDELRASFDAAASAEAKLVTVLDHLAECGDKPPDAALARHVAHELAAAWPRWREAEPAMALGALAVLAELQRRSPANPELAAPDAAALESLLFERGDPATLLRPVRSDRLALAILDYVRATLHASWHEVWAALLPGASQPAVERVAETLVETGRTAELLAALAVVLARPERHSAALTWLWKALCGDKLPGEVSGGIARLDVAVGLLTAAAALARDTTLDKERQAYAVGQIRNALAAKNFEWLRTTLKTADADGASRAFHATERNFVLGEHTRVRVLEVITETHPKLFFEAVQPWEEDVIYTTREGLKKRQGEFAFLVNSKMAANAKAIGDAAAHGDLSENAEFTAALEERNLLTEKASRMEVELQKSRVITAALAAGDQVTVGSTVVARVVPSSELQTMTFLGPWDGDPEHGVYSYKAAIALAFMGKRVGDSVELAGDESHRTWEVVEVRPTAL